MKIKSKTHGYLDYLVGVLLIAAPWIFDFYRGGAETWVPVALGAMAILYSLLTNYELGALRIIPFKAHLTLDVLSGIFLAASPWIFQFSDFVYLPHLVVGIVEIIVPTLTKAHTSIDATSSTAKHYSADIANKPTLSH